MERPEVCVSLFVAAALAGPIAALQEHAVAVAPRLLTRWAAAVSPSEPWPEYPRPRMVRKDWIDLNGRWDYAVRARDAATPAEWDGEILVPFCVESALSGVQRRVGPDQELWYRRSFDEAEVGEGRVLLHFGAVDWECTAWVNGAEAGSHRGGYDAFTFDVTELVRAGANELVVAVRDPTDSGTQPRGKQVLAPGGIWYTAVTGIWQTVWLEHVPASYVERLHADGDPSSGTVRIDARVEGSSGESLSARISAGGKRVAEAAEPVGKTLELVVPEPHAWSPDDPFLYDVELVLRGADGGALDTVQSYVGLRSIVVARDEAGVPRLFLNGAPLFQFGPLDQGWWPDGLYTAPTDEALRHDVEVTKALGFNMARKHVKVEPQRWYTWCDRLGLLVWQDMPSGDASISGDQPDITRSEESGETYERELNALVEGLRDHPSIVMWVPYNEGWGQWDTARICALIRALDPTRPVDDASGWTDRGAGDVHDVHSYPGPAMPQLEERRAAVLGEFGGLGLAVSGHTWQAEENWGYRSFASPEELTTAYLDLLRRLEPLVWRGLAAAVYTQTTDVEIEVNGLMTYDRARIKMPAEELRAAASRLYSPPPSIAVLAPTSAESDVSWRYTTEAPGDGWAEPGFDDGAWSVGPGGFGEPSTPGSSVRTLWKTADLWLRRDLQLLAVSGELRLVLHHDEDAEVYLNGVLAARLAGYTTGYEMVPLSDAATESVRPGRNVLAIHCHQTVGGQYVDAGLVELTWKNGER